MKKKHQSIPAKQRYNNVHTAPTALFSSLIASSKMVCSWPPRITGALPLMVSCISNCSWEMDQIGELTRKKPKPNKNKLDAGTMNSSFKKYIWGFPKSLVLLPIFSLLWKISYEIFMGSRAFHFIHCKTAGWDSLLLMSITLLTLGKPMVFHLRSLGINDRVTGVVLTIATSDQTCPCSDFSLDMFRSSLAHTFFLAPFAKLHHESDGFMSDKSAINIHQIYSNMMKTHVSCWILHLESDQQPYIMPGLGQKTIVFDQLMCHGHHNVNVLTLAAGVLPQNPKRRIETCLGQVSQVSWAKVLWN